jgi:hypothetical protein
MKKIIRISLFTITLLLFLVAYNVIEKETEEGFVDNPDLITVAPHSNWKGTPVDQNGRFTNLYQPFDSNFGDLLKWQLSKNPQKKEKKEEQRRL